MLDLHRLSLLHQFEIRGTITAVAEALGYRASTVSQQLATLEREIGVPLLVPAGRGLSLTPEGRRLAAIAGEMLDLEERALQIELGQIEVGAVRIAILRTVLPGVIVDVLDLLLRRHPRLRLEIAETTSAVGVTEVVARGFDLAIVDEYPGHPLEHRVGLTREELGRGQIRLATARDSIASSVADLRDAVWVSEPSGTAAHAWLLDVCRTVGFEPDIRYEATDLVIEAHLIASGHAVGVLPIAAWPRTDIDLRLVDLPGSPSRRIFAVTRDTSSGRADLGAVRAAFADAFGHADKSY